MPTFTLIQPAVVVGAGGATSIDFTSIPSTYTDLVIKLSTRSNNAFFVDSIGIRFNGSTSSYSFRQLFGSGASAGSQTASSYPENYSNGNTSTSNTFGNIEFYIPNYAGSTNKSISSDGVSENNSADAYATLTAGLWSNTAAITSISLRSTSSNNFLQYSTAYLYGVSNA